MFTRIVPTPLLALLLICTAVPESSCSRCDYTSVAFRTHFTNTIANVEHERLSNAGKHCSDFGGTYNPVDQSYGRNRYEGICKISVCGDGKVHDGYYCGVGPCYAFGYNCEGGCHQGDPVTSFKEIHSGKVWDVHVL